jgi:hypothetical protein
MYKVLKIGLGPSWAHKRQTKTKKQCDSKIMALIKSFKQTTKSLPCLALSCLASTRLDSTWLANNYAIIYRIFQGQAYGRMARDYICLRLCLHLRLRLRFCLCLCLRLRHDISTKVQHQLFDFDFVFDIAFQLWLQHQLFDFVFVFVFVVEDFRGRHWNCHETGDHLIPRREGIAT